MGSIEEARDIFSKDLYATELSGIEIDEIGKDYAKCSMKLTDKHKNAYGGVMGVEFYSKPVSWTKRVELTFSRLKNNNVMGSASLPVYD